MLKLFYNKKDEFKRRLEKTGLRDPICSSLDSFVCSFSSLSIPFLFPLSLLWLFVKVVLSQYSLVLWHPPPFTTYNSFSLRRKVWQMIKNFNKKIKKCLSVKLSWKLNQLEKCDTWTRTSFSFSTDKVEQHNFLYSLKNSRKLWHS